MTPIKFTELARELHKSSALTFQDVLFRLRKYEDSRSERQAQEAVVLSDLQKVMDFELEDPDSESLTWLSKNRISQLSLRDSQALPQVFKISTRIRMSA